MKSNQTREILQIRKALRDARVSVDLAFNSIEARLDRIDPPKKTNQRKWPKSKDEWREYQKNFVAGLKR